LRPCDPDVEDRDQRDQESEEPRRQTDEHPQDLKRHGQQGQTKARVRGCDSVDVSCFEGLSADSGSLPPA
jgi:hypothetical protein